MGRPKKNIKAKEPIRIRQRKLANGNVSLYLDIYIKGTRKYESLNLYLVPDGAPDARIKNAHTWDVATKIKSERIIALQDHGIRNWDKVKRTAMSLVDYLRQYEQDGFGLAEATLKGRRNMRKRIEEYLAQEKMEYVGISEVNQDFCRGFIRFLSTARNVCATRQDEKTIGVNSACSYQSIFNGALNKAVRDGIIPANPMTLLEQREKLSRTESEREYLTIEELRLLMATPCRNEDVKSAFLFACFVGLRLSDIRTFTWRKVMETPDGKTKYIHTVMEKTERQVDVPLSSEALKWIRRKEDKDAPVFTLPDNTVINDHIARWVKKAGIEKHITFHCSRHTFATMLLTLGADLYTTSKLLGHSSVLTTQIYGKIIDRKKQEAVNLVDDLFGRETEQTRQNDSEP